MNKTTVNGRALKAVRVALAAVFLIGITLLFLGFGGALYKWLAWMPKLQFLPAVLALNVVVIVALLLLTLVFGRVYCSVICPLGVFQDVVSHLNVARKRHAKNRRPFGYRKELKWLRYGIWVVFVAALIAGVNSVVALLAPYSAYGRIVRSIIAPSAAGPALIVAAVTLVVVVVLAWLGGRTYCNAVCPVGTTLSFFSRFAAFRPVIDKDKCRNCKVCEHNCKASCINIAEHKIDYSRCVDCFDCIGNCKFDALHYRFAWGGGCPVGAGQDGKVGAGHDKEGAGQDGKPTPRQEGKPQSEAGSDKGRRAFLAGTAIAVGSATLRAQRRDIDGGLAAIEDKKIPERETNITPPGSLGAENMYSHCTACQLCVAGCPNHVLRPSSGLEHFMQPESSYEKGWCRPECTRCGEVCPTGAILRITKEEKTAAKIGTARINRELCIAEDGVRCGNCARHCPAGAITMVTIEERGISVPAVDKERCIGCGACEFLCPARPVSAIYVEGLKEHRNI